MKKPWEIPGSTGRRQMFRTCRNPSHFSDTRRATAGNHHSADMICCMSDRTRHGGQRCCLINRNRSTDDSREGHRAHMGSGDVFRGTHKSNESKNLSAWQPTSRTHNRARRGNASPPAPRRKDSGNESSRMFRKTAEKAGFPEPYSRILTFTAARLLHGAGGQAGPHASGDNFHSLSSEGLIF